MNFINTSLGAINDLFRTMSVGARITSALLLAVVVISLVYLFRYQTKQADEYLFGGVGVDPQELIAIEGAFGKTGLGKYDIEGNRILVPRGQKSVYIAALVDNDALPRSFGDDYARSTSETSIWVSSDQRAEKVKAARQKELARIISSMSGIAEATVEFDETTRGGFPPRKERTAVVAVRPTAGKSLDAGQIKSIRQAIAAAIAGLDKRNVSVADLNSGNVYSLDESGIPSGADNPHLETKLAYETEWKKKIINRLLHVPDVIVEVNVELDPELQNATNSRTVDKPVPLHIEESSVTDSSRGPTRGGAPGTRSNEVGNQPAVVAATEGPQRELSETRSTQSSVVGQTINSTVKAPLTPTAVAASIAVPAYYIEQIWRKRNPTPEGQEPEIPDPAELLAIRTATKSDIERAVNGLLPKLPNGDDPYPRVDISFYDTIQPPPVETPGSMEQATTWLAGNWQSIGMVVVAFVSLFILRSALTSFGPVTPDDNAGLDDDAAVAGAGTDALEATGDETAEELVDGVAKKRLKKQSPDVRAQLADLVRQDPDAAANVLKSWIGEAA